jgi:hypothetical protein
MIAEDRVESGAQSEGHEALEAHEEIIGRTAGVVPLLDWIGTNHLPGPIGGVLACGAFAPFAGFVVSA